jgi:hypothetical protein
MEPGFGQNLEGFLIKGNLSLSPTENPALYGDGSIEGSGILYFDTIKEYNRDNNVTIQDIIFKSDGLIIPHTNPSDNLTSASVVIGGGVSIKHTQNSNSITSGGALTIAGGVSIAKNLNVGGIVNVNNNSIINVPLPILGTDAVNKDYVDSVSSNVSGNFTTGQIIIADSNGDSIKGFDFFTTDTNTLSLTIPFLLKDTTNANSTSGAFVCYGGISISKDVFIGGILDVNGNLIKNVASPINGGDAVNKDYLLDYVDSKTFGNILGSFGNTEIVVGTTSSNALGSYSSFTYDGSVLNLGGYFKIENTSDTTSLTSNPSLVVSGGANIYNNLFVGGIIDVNAHNINNVADPIVRSDAATKAYVDDKISNITTGNVNGNFTTGQLIIADTSGNAIRGFQNLTFDSNGTLGTLLLNDFTDIKINNTQNAMNLSQGGSFLTLGGASFQKDVYIGGVLDVNLNNIKSVADPIADYDAVNKRYLDEAISNINVNGGSTFNLNNNVLVPEDISIFNYPESVKAFITKIFVQYNQNTCALYTIYGLNLGNTWHITSTYIGDETGVTFYIRQNFGQGVMQYTNTNTYGFASISFTTITQIDDLESTTQLNYPLLNNVTVPTNIPDLVFLNNVIDSVKLIICISSETDHKHGMSLVNCVLKNGIWSLSTYNIGDTSGVKFNMLSSPTAGVLQYTNINASSDYIIRVSHLDILTTQTSLVLLANTVIPTSIGTSELTFQNTLTNFQLTCVVQIPSENKSALYEIGGVVCNSSWKLSSKYIGDYTGVKFSISTIAGVGVLEYTNSNIVDATMRYIKNAPSIFQPLTVNKGGTGNSYLNPYAVLRGNGSNPIVGTDDFIYKNKQLILGEESNILLKNTTNAISLQSGGALTVTGGASFQKDVYIGGILDVNLKNIKNVADPIEDYDAVNKLYVDTAIKNIDINSNENQVEQNYTLNNAITIPEDIPGFIFPPTIKAFISNIYVETSNQQYSLYTIRGINCNSNWLLSSSLIGQSTGVDFYIREFDGSGIVQYTNSNTTGVSSIRYMTTSLIHDESDDTQINYTLSGNVLVQEDIDVLTFSNTNLDSVKLLIYVSSDNDSKYGLFLANCVLKGDQWSMTTHNIGNVNGVKFYIRSENNMGIIGYTNSNLSNDYSIRVTNINIPNSQNPITLLANTTVPITIDETQLSLSINYHYFQISIFVNVPDLNKYALYEIQGVVCNDMWTINSRYIGDYTGIKFYISTVGGIGYLSYTNINNVDANIRFVKDIPLTSLKPLSINKGGTGSTYLNPYTILRGNGNDPIIGTSDLIYKDNELIIGNGSTIIIQNTRSSVNLTTGSTFIAYGGVSINKELFIGKQLVVKDVDITPNTGDISAERMFNAMNNQSVPSNVVGFDFSNIVIKSFTGTICVTTITDDDEYDALYDIRGLKRKNGWLIDSKYIGDDIGITFSITSNGQIQYTSENEINWLSTTMKFRALTTTM